MKHKFLSVVLLVVAFTLPSLADTTTVTTLKAGKFGGDVRDFDFPSANIGYAVGDDISIATNNFIGKTTDGGLTWQNITNASLTGRPWAVKFLSVDVGFVGASGGLLLRTVNGGSSWTSVNSSGYTGTIQDIQFASPLVGYACGTSGNGTFIKTTDGGLTWTAVSIGNTTTRYSILPFSETELLVSGSSGNVARTTDGGTTWSSATTSTNVAYNLARAGANTVFCASASNALYKSTDRGVTWALVFDNGASPLYAISMFDSLNGFIVGSNGVNYRTQTGWATFDSVLVLSFTAQVCRSVVMKSATEVLVGADMGNIFRSTDRGTSWSTRESGTHYYTLDFADANNGVAVGWRGTVIKTTNGGVTWTELRGANGFELYDVKMFDASTFYACGGSGRFYVTTNGGTSFTERNTPVIVGSLKSLHFLDAQTGYAVGEMGRIYRTSNAGTSWDSLYTFGASFNNIEDLTFADGSTAYAVGERGRVVKSFGGTTWDSTGIVRPNLLTLWESHFISSTVGYVASQNGSVYKTMDGGATWAQQNDTTGLAGVDVIDIHVVNPATRGYAVAEQGKLLKLVNANSWATERTMLTSYGTPDHLWGLDFVDTSRAFVSGYYGTIYRLDISRVTSAGENVQPTTFALEQNYPNPFNPTTQIGFRVQGSGLTTLKVYDVLGREVATLVNEVKQPGNYAIEFDASKLSSGVYYYRLQSGALSETKKMMLIR